MNSMLNQFVGFYNGRVIVQSSGKVGGIRSVFVQLQEHEDYMIYPPFGGKVQNPFYGVSAQMFAGDLMEMRFDEHGESGKIFLLKTYEVTSMSGTTLNIYRKDSKKIECYRHVPCVGDVLMIAPSVIGGAGTAVTVNKVELATDTYKDQQVDVWKVTTSATLSGAVAGSILVEGEKNGSTNMLVKMVNAVAPTDMSFDIPSVKGEETYESVRYNYTPTLGGLMYKEKMSPIPLCVEKLNTSHINGWFKINYDGVPMKLMEDFEKRTAALEAKKV